MLWKKGSAELVWETLIGVKNRGQSAFARTIAILIDLYDNDHKPWMEGSGNIGPEDQEGAHTPYLQEYFPNAWNNGTGYLQPFYMPFLQRLVNYVAVLFHRRPVFYLMTADGERLPPDHEQTRILNKMSKQCSLDTKLRKGQRLAYLLKTVFLFPSWHFGRMRIEVLTPDIVWPWEADRAPGDVQQCEWVAHELMRPMLTSVETGDRRFLQSAAPERDWQGNLKIPGAPWKMEIVDYWGERIPGDAGILFDDDVNPYGRHPYVVLHDKDFEEAMFAPLDGTFQTAAVGIDLLWTDYHLMMRQHGGVGVVNLQNPETWPTSVAMGVDRTINLGIDEKYNWSSPNFDIAGMIAFAQAYTQSFAVMHGITPDLFAISGTNFSSAVSAAAMEVNRLDVLEVREEAEPYYQHKIGQELWPLLVAIWNKWNPSEQIDTSLELGIAFPEPKQIVSPQEKAQARAQDMKIGIFDPVEAIMEDKNLSEAKAEEAFDKALERNRKAKEAAGEGSFRITPDPDDPGAAAE